VQKAVDLCTGANAVIHIMHSHGSGSTPEHVVLNNKQYILIEGIGVFDNHSTLFYGSFTTVGQFHTPAHQGSSLYGVGQAPLTIDGTDGRSIFKTNLLSAKRHVTDAVHIKGTYQRWSDFIECTFMGRIFLEKQARHSGRIGRPGAL
jgi:hypothetical protein